jgi:uncharacterized cupin superfamily protein
MRALMSEMKTCWLDSMNVMARTGSAYPAPFDEAVVGRAKRGLGDALGLTQFGVNLVTLAPGAWSSQRHWHVNGDEFVYVLDGEVTLVTDAGETLLKPGMAAGFSAGRANGHHLINRAAKPVLYLEGGTRAEHEEAHYSDIDLKAHTVDGRFVFMHKNGKPYS